MVHEPGSQSGRVNRKNKCLQTQTYVQPHQCTGQTKLPEIITLTVYRFQVKAGNRTVFFLASTVEGKTENSFIASAGIVPNDPAVAD